MKCPKCGYENKDDALYCGLCYEVLQKIQPTEVCHTELQPVEEIKVVSKKSNKWKIVLILSIVLVFLLLTQLANIVEFATTYRIRKRQAKQLEEIRLCEKARLEKFKPYSGETDAIKVKPVSDLGGLTHDAFAKFRKGKVQEYSFLNIFPENYEPFDTSHSCIYGEIAPIVNWIEGAQFYICNPYLLIILSCANHVTPIAFYCKNKGKIKVKYCNRKIEETYNGQEALNWFDIVYSYGSYPGVLRVWMVNAKDTGLMYVCIDKEKTVNIDFAWNSSANNIINSAYTCREYFHVGKYNQNNLSPANTNGRIKLLGKNRYTCIYFKLWMVKPDDINQKEDFTYIIKIIP
ncbi:MAG: zinc ribbon domain-containing protein [Elusimicrobia bacterium]|nr:zinc ribbon domain-containing protein [Elusimicrobiota bacterium]